MKSSFYNLLFSWSVNVIDGLLMIVAHLKSPSHSFYKILYKPYYIYSVWIIEVNNTVIAACVNLYYTPTLMISNSTISVSQLLSLLGQTCFNKFPLSC